MRPRPVATRAPFARALACLPLTLLLLGLFPTTAPARTGYPKVLNYYLESNTTSTDLQKLAKWDVLVLDADFPYQNPGAIDQIRALNPEIVILGYIAINGPSVLGYLRPPETICHKYWEGVVSGDFWLYDTAGGLASDWPDKGNTNLTPNSPVNAQGQQYWQWFAHFVDDEVWQHGQSEWDGIFLDNVWNSISWLNSSIPHPIDSDRNGVADPGAQLNAWWTASSDSCTALLRRLVGPTVPLMSNGANTYYGALNGTMIENFPYNGSADQNNIYRYAWNRWMVTDCGSYFRGIESYRASPMPLETINSQWPGVGGQPDTTGRFAAHKRIGLACALLGDGYFSLDNSLEFHSSTWWEPEYDIYLGTPTGPAYSYLVGGLTIWRRDYTEASVVVNPNNITLSAQPDIPKIAGWDAYIGPRMPPDPTAPGVITTLVTASIDSTSAVLRWIAPGDDGNSGTAEYYHGRIASYPINDANWESAPHLFWLPMPAAAGTLQSTLVTSLVPGTTYYVALRTEDDQANLSLIGNVVCFTTLSGQVPPPPPPPPPGDTTGPTVITDLLVIERTEATLTLAFTAPADAGGAVTAYDLRRVSGDVFATSQWATASAIPTGQPGSVGQREMVRVDGLSSGTSYAFRVRASDDAGNWSDLSGATSASTLAPPPPPPPVDVTPPAAIADLAAAVTDTFKITLAWVAPGDDGAVGRADHYDLRYRLGALALSTWPSATPVAGVPSPASSGSPQTFVLDGLPRDTTIVFALVTVDEAGNASPMSNLATARIPSPLPPPPPPPPDTQPPAAVENLAQGIEAPKMVTLSWAAAPEADLAFYRLYRGRGSSITPALYRDGLEQCTWEDRQVVPGREYVYAVTAVDASGNEGPRSALIRVRVPFNVRSALPEGVFAVSLVSPNPASGPMSLRIETGSALTVSFEVFDASGRLVCGPRFDTLGPGTGTVAWDGRGASGSRVPRGMYFVRVRGNDTSELRRVWVLP